MGDRLEGIGALAPEAAARLREIAAETANLQREAGAIMAAEAVRLSGNATGELAVREALKEWHEKLMLETFQRVAEEVKRQAA